MTVEVLVQHSLAPFCVLKCSQNRLNNALNYFV